MISPAVKCTASFSWLLHTHSSQQLGLRERTVQLSLFLLLPASAIPCSAPARPRCCAGTVWCRTALRPELNTMKCFVFAFVLPAWAWRIGDCMGGCQESACSPKSQVCFVPLKCPSAIIAWMYPELLRLCLNLTINNGWKHPLIRPDFRTEEEVGWKKRQGFVDENGRAWLSDSSEPYPRTWAGDKAWRFGISGSRRCLCHFFLGGKRTWKVNTALLPSLRSQNLSEPCFFTARSCDLYGLPCAELPGSTSIMGNGCRCFCECPFTKGFS